MKTKTTNYYTIEEHPNKEKVFEYIRDNWHNLNEHSLNEFIDSLKELAYEIEGSLNYSISVIPDRGEYIYLTEYNKTLLDNLNEDEYPLTGVCWDYDVIKALKEGNISQALTSLHKDTEYLYSDEGLTELCEINEWYFDINGEPM